ncbi:MAG: hypothetical protein HYZ26_09465 [Chloroflexi bacterium]|nr:hypothetical protein [Chloroflexota bacterium]
MPASRESMIGYVFATLFLMLALAVLSLRRRRLNLGQYLAYGLLALLIPALGPYLVIAYPPRQRMAERNALAQEPAWPLPRRARKRRI